MVDVIVVSGVNYKVTIADVNCRRGGSVDDQKKKSSGNSVLRQQNDEDLECKSCT